MHLPHFLDLVKIDHKASFIGVVFLDTLAAKDGEVIRTVEMLDALIVFFTEQAINALLVFEIDIAQNWITLDNFVKDVEV